MRFDALAILIIIKARSAPDVVSHHSMDLGTRPGSLQFAPDSSHSGGVDTHPNSAWL